MISQYLGNRCSKHDHLIKLPYPFHELIHTWPLDDINIMQLAFDLHRNGKVGLVEHLEIVRHVHIVEADVVP